MQLPAMMTAAHFHIRLGEKRQSVKLLEKAEKLAEGDSEAMSFIGYYYALNGVYLGRALQFTAQALKDRPEDSAYLRNYAVALWKNKRGDEAEKVFKKAIGKPAPVEFIFFDYGKFLLEAGRDKEAAAMFQKELEAEPELFEPAKALKAVSSKKPASRK